MQTKHTTFGQRLLRAEFNPSAQSDVTDAKRQLAGLADQLHDNPDLDPWDKEQAIRAIAECGMWVVRALTSTGPVRPAHVPMGGEAPLVDRRHRGDRGDVMRPPNSSG